MNILREKQNCMSVHKPKNKKVKIRKSNEEIKKKKKTELKNNSEISNYTDITANSNISSLVKPSISNILRACSHISSGSPTYRISISEKVLLKLKKLKPKN